MEGGSAENQDARVIDARHKTCCDFLMYNVRCTKYNVKMKRVIGMAIVESDI
ncbi:hypothetical protein BH09BAC1_BH09BAC1_03190 [soil metagenome]